MGMIAQRGSDEHRRSSDAKNSRVGGSEAGENASQLASKVLDYDKPCEKEDGRQEQRPAHSADVCQWLSE
jgi:hypothetical protein